MRYRTHSEGDEERPVRLTVSSPSRIHTGLLDESGDSGRIDGGFGFGLSWPRVSLEVVQTRASKSNHRIGLGARFENHIQLVSAIPKHVGLGSHTATAMATGVAKALVNGDNINFPEIAIKEGRGGTSGVGVHVAAEGGAVLDGGHEYPHDKDRFGPSSSVLAKPPPLVSKWSFPDAWKVVHFRLVDDQGVSGREEREFFARNCPIPTSESRAIAELVDGCLLPAMASADLELLHAFLAGMQSLGLKAREWSVQPTVVRELQDEWNARRRRSPAPLAPLGLSSVGPTLYLVTDDPRREVTNLCELGIAKARITTTSVPEAGTKWRWNAEV